MRIKEKLVKALKFIGAAAVFAVVIPFVSANASADTVGAFEVTGGTNGTDYAFANGVLTIKSDKAITIENTDRSAPTADRILIDKGAAANITLAGVNIETNTGAALEIAEDNDKTIKITLADGTTNTLTTKNTDCAGLQKNGISGLLTIEAQENGTGELIAQGGRNGAGIGGGNSDSKNIYITSGNVTATGGNNAAGIGGGYDGKGSTITISGGTVTATGGNNAAGIGGGNSGDGIKITISGGDVTANGGAYGAGIGGGIWGNGSDIDIKDGTVYAKGGNFSAGIGGGSSGGNGINITISGGTVTATGGNGGAGIGGGTDRGSGGEGSVIKITGGTVNATGGNNAAGIGGGGSAFGSDIEISGGTVNANGGSGGAGIGGGNGKNGSQITITNGKVNATGGDSAAGIGGGSGGEGSNIEINGGDVTANGGYQGGAGIGGGNGGNGSQITITNGTVNATGVEAGAGIGGGGSGTGSNITISGGTVTAKGNYGSAGIGGGGNRGVAKDIIISGGSVKAIPSSDANAIGSGSSAESSPLPTNGSGKNVFLYEIDNQSAADITIDGKAYPLTHGSDSKIYAYLSEGETHTIKLGYKTTYVKYNNGKFEEVTAPSSSTPSRPSRPKPEPVDNPIIGGEEKSWSSVAKEISELSEGEETSISLNGATKVPAEVIKAIKDSKAVVTFKASSAFSWTVDGSALTDSDIADIDFEINLITATGTETLRGTLGTSFAIDNITDKAALNISFKQIHAGKFANLYKIADEKLIFVDNVKIDENGEANGLSVHKSGEYVITLNELSDRPGDMDNDGIVNAKDALAMLKHVVGSISGANPLVADVNGDGVINAYDALAVLKMAVKIAV